MNNVLLPAPGTKLTTHQVAKMIDHSLLGPQMTDEDIIKGCELALRCDCATISTKQSMVPVALDVLRGSDVLVGSIVSFPHGCNTTAVKVFEAQNAIDNGSRELDMVMDIGKFRSGDYGYVEDDIHAVVETSHKCDVIVKVILENFYLNDDEIRTACQLIEKAGADFVKTASGYAGGGATIHDLRIMRSAVSGKVQVKAAGGVRTLDKLLAVAAVGGTRIGSTGTLAIVTEAAEREKNGSLVIPDNVPDDAI